MFFDDNNAIHEQSMIPLELVPALDPYSTAYSAEPSGTYLVDKKRVVFVDGLTTTVYGY